MSKRGVVTEVQVDEQGSELAAALSLSDVTVYLESAEDYDTEGGTVEINGVRMDYVTADLDAATLTLAAPSTVAGDISDRVSIIAGGEIAYDFNLLFSSSEGEAASIPIPFEKRAFWPEGVVDPPVPVTVSDDLSEVLDVPGRPAVVNSYAFEFPLFIGHLATDQAIASDSVNYTTVLGWVPTELRGGMTYDATTGEVVVPIDGYYSLTNSAVMWDVDPAGNRATQPVFNTADGDVLGGVNKLEALGSRQTTPVLTPTKPLIAGERVRFQVQQTAGHAVNLVGDSAGTKSFFCVKYDGPL